MKDNNEKQGFTDTEPLIHDRSYNNRKTLQKSSNGTGVKEEEGKTVGKEKGLVRLIDIAKAATTDVKDEVCQENEEEAKEEEEEEKEEEKSGKEYPASTNSTKVSTNSSEVLICNENETNENNKESDQNVFETNQFLSNNIVNKDDNQEIISYENLSFSPAIEKIENDRKSPDIQQEKLTSSKEQTNDNCLTKVEVANDVIINTQL